jgi:hypothetical protein
LGAVFSAEGNLVALRYARMFKKKMQFSHFPRHVAILQRHAAKIGERQFFPILFY